MAHTPFTSPVHLSDAALHASAAHDVHEHDEETADRRDWTAYVPLMVIVAVVAAAAFALTTYYPEATAYMFMRRFMGLFLCVFAMLKLFDIRGFADGFSMYDLLAKRVRTWAHVYPFVELTLGLCYLADAMPVATNIALIVVMLFGVTGVALALRRGLDVNCACMGTILKVPLSTVALIEDLAMAAMAAMMLVMLLLA